MTLPLPLGPDKPARRRSAGEFFLRILATAGLAYDAYVHIDLASNFDANIAVLSQGTVFRIDAGFAVLAGLLVLITHRRVAAGFAVLVAGGALGALLLYR